MVPLSFHSEQVDILAVAVYMISTFLTDMIPIFRVYSSQNAMHGSGKPYSYTMPSSVSQIDGTGSLTSQCNVLILTDGR